MNITEKILAKASGKKAVHPGEIVDANVDMVMIHDLTGPLAVEAFKKIGTPKVWDNKKVVVILDHQVPAESVKAAELHKTMRQFAKDQNLQIYDVGRGGICHQVMPDKGHVVPGAVIVGADSHTCTYGAFGAFATGIGSTEAAAVMATGKIWFKIPEAIKINVTGKFKHIRHTQRLSLSHNRQTGRRRSNLQKPRIHWPNHQRNDGFRPHDAVQHGSGNGRQKRHRRTRRSHLQILSGQNQKNAQT